MGYGDPWIKGCKKLEKQKLCSSKNTLNSNLLRFLSNLYPTFTTEKMNDFGAGNLTKITQMQKNLEDGLVEHIDHAEKKSSKLHCSTRPSSRWNSSLKLKIVLCKYLCTSFLGEIFERIQLVPFFLSFCSEIEKENQNLFISALPHLSGIYGRG